MPGRPRWPALLLAGLVAGLAVAGCGAHAPPPRRGSVRACMLFGISAIERRVTVATVPAACSGLSPAQVNFAVANALQAAIGSIPGKVRRRDLAVRWSALLARLITTVPPARARAPAAAAAPAPAGRPPLGAAALAAWLVTVALGSWMLVRWLAHDGIRRARADPALLPPWMIFAHFGLATAGLLVWIGYLVTRQTAVAWAACLLLLPVTGLGMALVTLWLPDRAAAPDTAAGAGMAVVSLNGARRQPAPLVDEPVSARHPPPLIVAGHGVAAVCTIIFAVLAAIGPGG